MPVVIVTEEGPETIAAGVRIDLAQDMVIVFDAEGNKIRIKDKNDVKDAYSVEAVSVPSPTA